MELNILWGAKIDEIGIEHLKKVWNYQKNVVVISKTLLNRAYGNINYNWTSDDFEIDIHMGLGRFGQVVTARERATCFKML